MRKFLLLAALGFTAAFGLPAAAEPGDEGCGVPATAAPSEPLDLNAIPMKIGTGHKAIQGVADDDECDGKTTAARTSSKDDSAEYGEDGEDDD